MRPMAVPTAWTGWPVPRDHEVQGRLLSTVASEAVIGFGRCGAREANAGVSKFRLNPKDQKNYPWHNCS